MYKIDIRDPVWVTITLWNVSDTYHFMLGKINKRTTWLNANSLQAEVGKHKSLCGCSLTPNDMPPGYSKETKYLDLLLVPLQTLKNYA